MVFSQHQFRSHLSVISSAALSPLLPFITIVVSRLQMQRETLFLSFFPRVSFHIKLTKCSRAAGLKPHCIGFLLSHSVEHDFRQQEGRLQSVMEALDGEYDVPAPALAKAPPPATLPAYRATTKGRVKKLRKKCFWWL